MHLLVSTELVIMLLLTIAFLCLLVSTLYSCTLFVPVGAVFDNAYHLFLRNTIIEDTAGAFASNTSPFPKPGGDFGNWFLVDKSFPNELAHLDTDVTLAFPPLNTSHPDYSMDTILFADDNNLFLKTFFAALHKMGRLGVNVELFNATNCKDPCGNQTEPIPGRPQCIVILAKFLESALYLTCFPFLVGVDLLVEVITSLGNATALGEQIIAQIQANRSDVIDFLTTLASDKFTDKPTSTPTVESNRPRDNFTGKPTSPPTTVSNLTTLRPSVKPSKNPSSNPSTNPSSNPSGIPSSNPSGNPSTNPSSNPSGIPSSNPSDKVRATLTVGN
jgi:hypothetical protein